MLYFLLFCALAPVAAAIILQLSFHFEGSDPFASLPKPKEWIAKTMRTKAKVAKALLKRNSALSPN